MNPYFTEFKRNGTCGIQREIGEFLRRGIESGALAPGERLPPLRELAQLWGSNFFSVKLATDELRDLGLLNKQQGCGVFVASNRNSIRSVGLYFSNAGNNASQNVSFHAINNLLCQRLSSAGYRHVIWNDCRPESEHTSPPEEMTRAIISGEVQVVVGLIVRDYDKRWFFSLPVKKISKMADRFPEGGWEPIAQALLQRRRVAGILSATEPGRSFIIDALQQYGVRFMPRRTHILNAKDYIGQDWIKLGYRHAMELLDVPTRPDALLVYPDNMAPGIFYAIYQLGLRVPEDLLLVMHRNVELDYFAPFPVMYLDTSLTRMADTIFQACTGIAPSSGK